MRVAHPCHQVYSYIDQCSSAIVSTSKSASLSCHQCSDIKQLSFSLFIATFDCFGFLPPNLNGFYRHLTSLQNATLWPTAQLLETYYSRIHNQGSCFFLPLIVAFVVICFLDLKRRVMFLLLSSTNVCNNTTQREADDFSFWLYCKRSSCIDFIFSITVRAHLVCLHTIQNASRKPISAFSCLLDAPDSNSHASDK